MSKPELSANGMHGYPSGKKSNTWIIVLVVVAVLAVLSLFVCGGVAALVYPAFRNAQQRALVNSVEVRISLFASALEMYRLDTNGYPTTEQGLMALRETPNDLADPTTWNGPYVAEPIPLDPWGNEYQYELLNSDRFRIWSMGPDGESGSDDDIGFL